MNIHFNNDMKTNIDYLMNGGAMSKQIKIVISLVCLLIIVGIISLLIWYFIYKSDNKCDAATTCRGRGTCNNDGTCKCDSGFSGVNCSISDTCNAATTCGGRGTCNADGTCKCNTGFSGSNCSINNSCNSITTCRGRGICNNDGTCTCNVGFSGADCSIGSCDPDTTCKGRGVCSDDGICICHDGYTGEDCGINPKYISFYPEINYQGNPQTFPWNIDSIYIFNAACLDNNTGIGAKYRLNIRPKSIKWIGFDETPDYKLWLTGFYGNTGDTVCGPSTNSWWPSSFPVDYSDMTLVPNSQWKYTYAMGYFSFKP